MTLKHRNWSQKTVQKWADHWAAELMNTAQVPKIITNAAEFTRLTGCRVSPRDLGVSGVDYIYVNAKDQSAGAVRDTVIHELLHLARPTWPHWKVRWTAADLAHGRSGELARLARTEGEYLERAERFLLQRDQLQRVARRYE